MDTVIRARAGEAQGEESLSSLAGGKATRQNLPEGSLATGSSHKIAHTLKTLQSVP